MLSHRTRTLAGCVSALVVGTIATSASAGMQILLDQTSPPGMQFYANDGQYWMKDYASNTPLTIASAVIPLDFGTGGGAPASRTLRQENNGRIDFLDTLGNTTSDYIQTLFPVTPASFSSVTASSGLLDPGILGSPTQPGPYNVANGLQAFRFTWSAVCAGVSSTCPGNTVTFQTVLVALGANAFLVEFNYGFDPSPSGETAGFTLGGQSRSFNGPFTMAGPDYCFSNGQLGTYLGGTSCRISPAAVAEPSSVALVFAGLAGIGGLAARHRRRRAGAAHPGSSAGRGEA